MLITVPDGALAIAAELSLKGIESLIEQGAFLLDRRSPLDLYKYRIQQLTAQKQR